ncbi:MAG TPA: FAD-binding oxidoreductase [Solirubrobacteraceae bacterium]|nr:FAD-binding oxidoreductase [Solirubrobacteraceae bacterium]
MTFAGELHWRGEAGYEEARVGRVFNARRPDRHPAAVLLAESEDDVIAGVRLARDRGLKVSVRAGGHSWAAWSLRDDAVLIDLGRMGEIGYDPDTGIATASPAVKGGAELTPFLTSHGRAFPGGHCPSVGIGGFLLQGGQGWNGRKCGWACESVVAIDVVTADGELIRADEEQNSDLLWAARGAGPGFFGVITRFHLRTYALPRAMTHDTWTFELDDLEPLLAWIDELLPSLDRVVEPVIAATRLPRPEGPPVLLLHTTAMCETTEEAERVLAPLQACPIAGRAIAHDRGPTTIEQENEAQALQNPEGHRYGVDCTWTDARAPELVPYLRPLWSELPTEHSFSIWYGWAPRRPLPDMAFSVEGRAYIATYAIWSDPAEDERHRSWVVEHTTRLAALGKGVYLGDTDFTRRPDRFAAPENFRRLEEIRARRDPDGRFCSYLIADGVELNGEPDRRRRTASAR